MQAAVTNKSLSDRGLHRGHLLVNVNCNTVQSRCTCLAGGLCYGDWGGGENSFLPLAPSHCIAPGFSASHQWIWRREGKAQLHFKLLNLEITLFTSAHICLQSMQVAVQLLSCFWLFATPWTAAHQASLSFTVSQSLLKFMPHWVGDTIPPSHPLLPSSFAFSLFPGSTRVRVHSG